MAGIIQADFLQPQSSAGLSILNPSGNTVMASVNSAGIFSSTGSLLVANTGNVFSTGNVTASGTVTTSSLVATGTSTFTNNISAPNTFGFKNRLINGAMVIDQRASGASTSVQTSTTYATCDRWQTFASTNSAFSIQQNAGSVTPPAGFTNYLGCTTASSSYSVGAGDYFGFRQGIEGYNIADWNWGTANAKTITLSFWVYSSLTGTFGGVIKNQASTRSYPYTYSISSTNTWTYITVTIPGDTTTPASNWPTNNTNGVWIQWGLGVGSTYSGAAGSWQASNLISATGAVSVVGTANAYLYVTGVQVEVGTQATSFDYRPYTTELQLCQRYFETSFTQGTAPGNSTAAVNNGTHQLITCYNTNQGWINGVYYKVQKRTSSSSITTYSFPGTGSGGTWGWYTTGWNTMTSTTVDFYSDTAFGLLGSSSSSFASGSTFLCTGAWAVSAEL